MITDDDLRALLGADEAPAALSPSAVRQRARRIRRGRRLGAAAAAALVVPLVALLTVGLPGVGSRTIDGAAGDPPAFDGYGNPLQQQPDGKVVLDLPHLYAYTGPGDLCWGSAAMTGVGGMCVVAPANGASASGSGTGMSIGDGVIGSISVVPVARADFISGSHVVHAQVVGFAKYPNWRTLTAAWDGPVEGVLLRGWDVSGRLVLSVGCPGGCPISAQPSQPPVTEVPAPAASSARPAPVITAVPDGRDVVVDGVEAWPTADGVCVGDQGSTQCVADGDSAIDNGFALGKDIAVTIVGQPLARAEFLVGTTSVEATVLGYASHPQWRVVAANLKIPDSAGKPVRLRGWDAGGKLVVDTDPTGSYH
ncbi:hypothetical protein acdb102_39870 [Acidothermaceae bacterium B102]|nr:hypothetical protein acdb102_39870 [Acidothermaceae bacterium B102]